jgi:cation:H+ antiporter
MEEFFHGIVGTWSWPALLATLVVSLAVLAKGADWLVEEAVTLSLRSGMPPVVVGATVVSLGTTSPEAFVSVFAALSGNPTIALGNAVGSVICDTGLVLGIGCLIAPLPFDRRLVNRQGWVQFGCGVLLVACTIPWANLTAIFSQGSGAALPRVAGFLLVALLLVYLVWSVRIARGAGSGEGKPHDVSEKAAQHSIPGALLRMAVAVALVIVSAGFLIATAQVMAERMEVPPSIVAATLIAFGTSLPELVIVVTAVMKGQPDLAIGNVIGADILNVLFVAGIAASVTPAGLAAGPEFFKIFFPGMLFLLLVFRVGIWCAKDDKLARPIGAVLVLGYLAITGLGFVFNKPPAAATPAENPAQVEQVEPADL